MTIYADTFNRSTSGSIGTASGGWTWAENPTNSYAGGNFECVSSKAQAVSGDFPEAYTPDLATDDHNVSVDINNAGGGSAPTLYIRADSVSNKACNAYQFTWLDIGPVYRVYKRLSGAETSIGSNYSCPASGLRSIVFRCVGTSVQMYENGVLMLDITDSTVTSGKKTGIGTYLGTTWDNFSARDCVAQAAFPSTGLKGQWRLNEAAGANNAIDDSGNSHDLTQTSSPGSTTGIESTARTFDGSADYFSVADHADLSPTTKMTFAAWAYRSSGTNLCIASKWNYDVGADGWALQEDRVYVGTSTEFTYARPSSGAWHHFCLVVDTTQSTDALKVAVYIDGVLQVKGGSPTVALNDNADAFALGVFPGLGRYWNGNIDLAQFWKDVALTQDEVLDLWNAGAGLAYTAPGGGSAIKTINSRALASVKTKNGLAVASMKTLNGLA